MDWAARQAAAARRRQSSQAHEGTDTDGWMGGGAGNDQGPDSIGKKILLKILTKVKFEKEICINY